MASNTIQWVHARSEYAPLRQLHCLTRQLPLSLATLVSAKLMRQCFRPAKMLPHSCIFICIKLFRGWHNSSLHTLLQFSPRLALTLQMFMASRRAMLAWLDMYRPSSWLRLGLVPSWTLVIEQSVALCRMMHTHYNQPLLYSPLIHAIQKPSGNDWL